MKYLKIIPLALLLLFSCSKGDDGTTEPTNQPDPENPEPENPVEPAEVRLLTLKNTSNLSSDAEYYIIISDADGEAITTSKITNDIELKAKTELDQVNITLLTAIQEYDNFKLVTYTNVPIGKTWILQKSVQSSATGSETSKSIVIKNSNLVQGNNYFNAVASNKNGTIAVGGGTVEDIEMNLTLKENDSKDILIMLHDGITHPKFKWLDFDSLSDGANFDFETDLNNVDKLLEYNFQNLVGLSMSINAFEPQTSNVISAADGYQMTDFVYDGNTAPGDYLAVGYLEGDFDYYSKMFLNFGGYNYHYIKFGDAPEVFDESFFDSDFEITDWSVDNFTFTTTGDFEVASGFYTTTDGKTQWQVYYPESKEANKVLTSIPKDIAVLYPDLNITNLDFTSARFTDMIQDEGYDVFLENIFNNELNDNVREEYVLSKNKQ